MPSWQCLQRFHWINNFLSVLNYFCCEPGENTCITPLYRGIIKCKRKLNWRFMTKEIKEERSKIMDSVPVAGRIRKTVTETKKYTDFAPETYTC